MTNFNYLKITKTRKIRYIKHVKKSATYIVFLHGFMSDLEGKKPKVFLNFAKSNITSLSLACSICTFKYICLSSCLKVVWKLSVPEYILTLKIDSTASVLP